MNKRVLGFGLRRLITGDNGRFYSLSDFHADIALRYM